VVGGDSGELICAARVLGVAHPPGYPLYTLLGHLATLLPLGSVAVRVNLLSALADAGAAGLLCLAIHRVTGRAGPGVLAGLAFALSPMVWPYAVTAEVFALNNLLVAALLALSVRGLAAPERTLPAAALVFGLGLSNHHTILFLGGPLLLGLAWQARAHLDRRLLLLSAAALALGLLPYLHLVIGGLRHPALAWGETAAPAGFLDHLLRREYGTLQLGSSDMGGGGGLAARLRLLGTRFASSTLFLGPPLLALAVLARSRARAFAGLWAAAAALYVAVFFSLANLRLDDPLHVTVEERFSQQTLLVLAALCGVGLASAVDRLRGGAGRWIEWGLACGLPLALLAVNGPAQDQRHNTFFRDYAQAVLAELPPSAILLATSDEAFGSVRYLQLVEGVRPDVQVVPTGHLQRAWFPEFARRHLPGVVLPPFPFTARAFLDANLLHSPVFLLNKLPWLQTLEEAYTALPVGLVDQVVSKGATPELGPWIDDSTRAFGRFDAEARAAGLPEGSWERYVARNLARQHERWGLAVATAAARASDPMAAALQVVRALSPLAERPGASPTLLKNLGVAYQFVARTDPQAREGMRRAWQGYLKVAPPDDRDLPAIRKLLAEQP
jgi:hypothetical protein